MSKKILTFLLVLSLFAVAALADGEGIHTYNSAQTEFPTNWSPHQNQTQIDSELMTNLGNGLYTFDYNDEEDGYKVVPDAAADFPVDVTADYVGAWEDGTHITAGDFVTSAKLLLNPEAQNHRADMLYSGNLVIENAEAYLKQGIASDTALSVVMGAEELSVEDLLAKYGEEAGCINWGNSFGDTYDFEAKAWTGEAEDAVVKTPLTLAELYAFYTTGEGRAYATWASDEQMVEWANDELFMPYMQFAGAMDFDKVGIQAPDDHTLVLVLAKPLSGFYLYYSLTDYWLVNETLYHACETTTDGVYNNTYGTSKETSMSFGPYRLAEFQSDKTYLLEKNPHWYGWNDPVNEGWYQTDAMRVDCVSEISTRMEMFMSGLLDVVGLDKDHIGDYATSEYTYYDEGDSVFAMVFNPEFSALKTAQEQAGAHINKTILTLKDFRMAMSLGLNRQEFCLAASPTNEPAFALYGGQIVADPEQGLFYRTTDVAKQVVVDFWGLTDEIGEGKLYADADEAIDSLSGYNLEMARQYFDAAYDEAIAQGLMKEDDVVEIMVGTPNETSAFYNSGYDFIVNNYTEAVKGTKLEGKFVVTDEEMDKYPTFRRGDRYHPLIYRMQQRLADLAYYTIRVDGIYGSGTERAVRLFQQINGLKPTGIADGATQARLYSKDAKSYHDWIPGGTSYTLYRSNYYQAAVVPLQRRLRELGYYAGAADGYFGSATYRAVRNFQSRNGLVVTGAADPATQARLYSASAKPASSAPSGSPAGYRLLYWGCKGEAVLRLQRALLAAGYTQVRTADGIYGKWTYDAVRAFQRNHGLAVDGIAGRKTQNALYGTHY